MELKKLNKILIINLGGIGDVLLSFPALKALRNACPQAEISILVTYRASAAVKNLPYFNEIYTFRVGYGGLAPFGKMFANLKTLLWLRKKQFDLAVNMRTLVSTKGAKKIKFILNIIRPGIKAGRNTDGRGYFFDIKIPESIVGEKYEMEYDIDTVKALGVNFVGREIELKPEESSIKKINEILRSGGISESDTLIGIHPGGMPSRRWPAENFIEMIESLTRKDDYSFVFTGNRDEACLTGEIAERTGKKAMNLAGKLNFHELTALIKRCDLFISNDTGPMHIAAVLKTPLIAIFGPGDFIRFDPRNIFDKTVVFYNKADCAPCEKKNCDSVKCFNGILPEEVAEAARFLIHC